MTTRRIVGGILIALLASGIAAAQRITFQNLVPTTREAPSEFGTQDYVVTTIPAVAFAPESNDTGKFPPFYTSVITMARFYLAESGVFELYAPVIIPAGAVIDYIGLDTKDFQGFLVGMQLVRVGSDGVPSQLAAFSSTAHDFGMDYNAAPLGIQISSNLHQQFVLNVEMAGSSSGPAFGFAEIWWRRTVSPAPPVAAFNDVPTTHPFYQFVAALAASGITAGCGSGNYCPDSPLTRGQMAVFLSKALGLHWPY